MKKNKSTLSKMFLHLELVSTVDDEDITSKEHKNHNQVSIPLDSLSRMRFKFMIWKTRYNLSIQLPIDFPPVIEKEELTL